VTNGDVPPLTTRPEIFADCHGIGSRQNWWLMLAEHRKMETDLPNSRTTSPIT